ncbi:Oxysterol binding protein [Marasmius oreades]|uniref:Oxysterol binding protein n=1 Tax=Marasmius oreades TaxID=181124 RepID=A0A9P7UMX9_9AGAR|nr:Oxysterol binding protein [Marasmius oreades]KAG7087618.1 Oxysterol binding protein [Marasmius oreades]
MAETPGDAVPAAQRGSWSSFLKAIASMSGDLSSMTAPPFILSPVSLTEFPAYWCEHPELFAAIADQKNEEDRAIAVLKWFVSTLKGQYTSRNESMGSEKKPLNPALGELFYGQWPNKNGRGQTDLLVEQVSHHPPITAYVIHNKTKGIKLVGHNAQKTSFSSGSIIVKQIGHAILTVELPSGGTAKYLVTLPKLRIDGVWYGSPYIELSETSYIISQSHFCTIEYKGKGYFTGKSHSFKATLSPTPGHGGASKEHTIEGTWHTTSKYASGPRSGQGFHDVTGPKEEVTAIGGNADGTMGPFETRELWKYVAKGIREGDFETASKEKSKIENEQRQRRKDEVAAGTSWKLTHFEHIDSDPLYEQFGKVGKITPQTDDAYVFKENWPPVPSPNP